MNDWDTVQDSAGVRELETAPGGRAVPDASAASELARLFLSDDKDHNLVVSNGRTWEEISRNNALASTLPEGTRAAVEYVTRPDYAARPKYFQALVRAYFKSQVPIQVQQVRVHVLGNS